MVKMPGHAWYFTKFRFRSKGKLLDLGWKSLKYVRMTALDESISLMRKALALLDDADEPVAAAYLQTAIDRAMREYPAQPGDRV